MGKARGAKAIAPADDGFRVPFKVMPLCVYGAWRQGDWSDIEEKDGHFTVKKGQVVYVYHGGNPAANRKDVTEFDLGALPKGWAAEEIYHDLSDSKGWFVGPAAAIAKLKELQDHRGATDDAMGEILHYPGAMK